MSEIAARIELQIPFHDADPAGVVWHGRYPRYFEVARCALMDRIGYSYPQMEATRTVWPVVDLQIRYLKALRYHETITVTATLSEWEYRLRIAYRIERGEQEVTRGHTVQVPVDAESDELIIGCPEAFTECVRRTMALIDVG